MSRASEPKVRIPVCLAEYNPLAARYLQDVLKRAQDFSVSICESLVDGNARSDVCVLLIDHDALPGPLPAYLHSVCSRFPKAVILAIGAPIEKEDLCRLLSGGVCGFVEYQKIEEQLCNAIRYVWSGHLWVEPAVLETFAKRAMEANNEKKRKPLLTSCERIVLDLLQQRLSNKEIGSALGISDRTVKFHLTAKSVHGPVSDNSEYVSYPVWDATFRISVALSQASKEALAW
jgi:DNA-binding NarL/FixJ family response regulator